MFLLVNYLQMMVFKLRLLRVMRPMTMGTSALEEYCKPSGKYIHPVACDASPDVVGGTNFRVPSSTSLVHD